MSAAIQYLIENLPKVLVFLISGYTFLSVYKYVRNTNSDGDDGSKNLLPSITVSFIIKLLYDYFIQLYNINLIEYDISYMIILIIVSIVFGYMASVLVNSKEFCNLITRLNIFRSVNSSFWIDICNPTSIYEIHLSGEQYSYIGQIQEIEYSKTKPMIQIYNYAVIDYKTRAIVSDMRYNSNATLAINTQNVDVVHILDCNDIYNEQQQGKLEE